LNFCECEYIITLRRMNVQEYYNHSKFCVVIDDKGSKIYDKKINNFMLRNIRERLIIAISITIIVQLLVNNSGPSMYLRGSVV